MNLSAGPGDEGASGPGSGNAAGARASGAGSRTAGGLRAGWAGHLRTAAAGYARVAMDNITREFPSSLHHVMTAPGDFPDRPRERNPVFYGSYDWHSCVEMHWLLVRLLRLAGDAVPATAIRALLDEQFTPAGLATEAGYIAGAGRWGQRPYGWGWALALVAETTRCPGPSAARWADAMAPLADAVTGCFLEWLPRAAYPVRHGVHENSAFGLSRALEYAGLRAREGDPALLEAITAKAHAWFGGDARYPGGWEPSGQDFLSPALAEAELMAAVLPAGRFPAWLAAFLPGIGAGEPAALFTPAAVSDSADGLISHLHGLNASRAWCWLRIAEALPAGDPRAGRALAAARAHAAAALPHVTGSGYMVEHWLAAYAVLLLT